MKSIEFDGYTINLESVPHHMGIIMDGNGRWATKQGLTRSQGHRAGVERIRDLLDFGRKYGIQEISLYTFSTENWSRPRAEVDYLFRLVKLFFTKNIEQLHQQGIRVRVIGIDDGLPKSVVDVLRKTSRLTAENKTLTLNLCFNYGGYKDLLHATRSIIQEVEDKKISLTQIDETCVRNHLLSHLVSDVDLLIRTSNEYRVSNFLPWQISYAEFLFIPTLWPDFSEKDFVYALDIYSKRQRRFGGVKL